MRTGAGRPEPAGVATGRAAAPDGRPTNARRPARGDRLTGLTGLTGLDRLDGRRESRRPPAGRVR
ncbi:hypothetical protein ADU20_11035 [Burkholderia pseudomallei]|nr:hypothetical protein ADU20_11035 [Burkholderia pseudomallei]